MKQVTIESLKNGDIFKFENTDTSPLWVKTKYLRSIKKYEAFRYEDINHFTFKRKGFMVWIN